MKENDTELDEKLHLCGGSFLTFYLKAPAEGAHFYSNIAYVVVNSLLSVLGVFLNLLVIIVYGRNNTLRTSSNMLFAVLAFGDLMVSSIVQPLLIARTVKETIGTHNCVLWTLARLTSYFCCGVSLLTVAIISIERFVTLAFPYSYQNIISPFRLKTTVALTWIVIFAFVTSHLGPVPFTILSAVGGILIILTLCTIVPTWIWIQRLVRRHKNAIESNQTPTDMNDQVRRQRKKLFRTTNTCYMIVGAVLCFYFPSLVLLGYIATHDYNFFVLFLISPWAETVMFANSVLNPILLFWRKETFRETAREILS